MKKIIYTSALIAILLMQKINLRAQNLKAAVMPLDAREVVYDSRQLGNLLNIELEKTNYFKAVDRYEIETEMRKRMIKPDDCFAKSCAITIGEAVSADKVISGSVERFDEKNNNQSSNLRCKKRKH